MKIELIIDCDYDITCCFYEDGIFYDNWIIYTKYEYPNFYYNENYNYNITNMKAIRVIFRSYFKFKRDIKPHIR